MRLDEFEIDADSDIIIGGDFNVILDCDRDGFGGKPIGVRAIFCQGGR